ncbi:DUF3291 domain-containing protein [Fulvivirga sp. M361]|uniref:DUF3291 domain-containing protein n=1 Tax=Fulvivirga sp. M361 TaxID=2594266 RepID=UPI001179FD63|nr:DUF3291 domain-containing protein [Fulvivirga sp. M361]TRX57542.1 DUF3291 domain-containing protein [Fulvivirga sp. M361]
MDQVTTIAFFRFSTTSDKFWALKMMQMAHQSLKNVKGQRFYRLLGSGKGKGFNPLPDWSVYSLLQVWDNLDHAEHFFDQSQLLTDYKNRSSELWCLYFRAIAAKGKWSGSNPFELAKTDPSNNYVAVITRATIKWNKMVSFWRYVPKSHRPLNGARGLMYTKGIGEIPLVQMATFSLWESEEQLTSFAYGSEEHKEAIRLTRELNWYKEELFARFQPFRSEGTWEGINPLPKLSRRNEDE